MRKLRYLHIRFDASIEPHEIPAFRGAVIAKAGREHDLFHNHYESAGSIYRYPLIQYKRIGRSPAIICLDEGTEDIHHFFQNRTWDVELNGRPVELRVKDLRLNQYTLQAWEYSFSFSIRHWLALNQENYLRFMELPYERDRIDFLERILRGNILSMAKGLDWYIDREVRVRIRHLSPPRKQRFKEHLLTAFDATFDTNVFLPDFIGLGKGVSLGFGVVTRRKEEGRRGEREQRSNDQ
ncbi:hypothetical protein GCM10023187_34680 [Nibrella viscosa]|uniref:Uncharacterized protein n=1 Tax=Nibrella viscosa TaxID=1084524 RepID=A0ABP8KMK8_9BACT